MSPKPNRSVDRRHQQAVRESGGGTAAGPRGVFWEDPPDPRRDHIPARDMGRSIVRAVKFSKLNVRS